MHKGNIKQFFRIESCRGEKANLYTAAGFLTMPLAKALKKLNNKNQEALVMDATAT